MVKKILLLFIASTVVTSLALKTSQKPQERKLLSWESTEIDNRAYEINEFRKQMSKFLSVLKDKQTTENHFKKIIGDHLQEMRKNMKKGKETIRELHNNSMVNLDGMMTILGFGLD